MYITAMSLVTSGIKLTVINHMLKEGDYIYVTTAQGVVLNGQRIYAVELVYLDDNSLDSDNVVVYYPPELNLTATFTGSYTGGENLGAAYPTMICIVSNGIHTIRTEEMFTYLK